MRHCTGKYFIIMYLDHLGINGVGRSDGGCVINNSKINKVYVAWIFKCRILELHEVKCIFYCTMIQSLVPFIGLKQAVLFMSYKDCKWDIFYFLHNDVIYHWQFANAQLHISQIALVHNLFLFNKNRTWQKWLKVK